MGRLTSEKYNAEYMLARYPVNALETHRAFFKGIYDKLKCYEDAEEQGRIFDAWELVAVLIGLKKLEAYTASGLTPERATELSQAEQDGRLVELPCKLGQQLWQPLEDEIVLWDVGYITKDIYGDFTIGCLPADDHDLSEEFLADVIGVRLFLTRAEAEAALKERQANNGNN